jgi:hypothetical protein
MSLLKEKELWSQKMLTHDKKFYKALKENSASFFESIRVVKLSELRRNIGFSDPTIDPGDILCFVEKCVDERFIYTRSLPEEAFNNPLIKYNYRQTIADFGIPGVGCLYSKDESTIIAKKIGDFLIKNNIPVFISEAHEGCGAIMAKCSKLDNGSDSLFLKKTAQSEALSVSHLVKDYTTSRDYKVDIYNHYATIEEYCYRVKDDNNEDLVANIHNGTGIIFLPDFFDKRPGTRVFLPDKFCLLNNICMFNIIDSGSEFDFNTQDNNNPNSTAEYIVFCIKIMLGNYGLGEDFFDQYNPIQIIAPCHNELVTDVLRSYKVIQQVKKLLAKEFSKEKMKSLFDFVLLEY